MDMELLNRSTAVCQVMGDIALLELTDYYGYSDGAPPLVARTTR